MDIERIQKINALALDLMKQGLASDREDAVIQAEKVYREKSEGYRDLRETMKEIREERGNEVVEDISQEKIKDILEKNTNFLVNKIKEFQEKIASLEKEMGELRKRMVFQGSTTKEFSSQVIQEQPKPQPAKDQSPSKHPRSGDYKEGDVSIEKFFYMGGNR